MWRKTTVYQHLRTPLYTCFGCFTLGQGPPDASQSQQTSESTTDSSVLTGLAIACAFFGIITLICLCVLVYKVCISGR